MAHELKTPVEWVRELFVTDRKLYRVGSAFVAAGDVAGLRDWGASVIEAAPEGTPAADARRHTTPADLQSHELWVAVAGYLADE